MARKIKEYYAEVKHDEHGAYLAIPIVSKGKEYKILIDTGDYARFSDYNWTVLRRRGEASYIKRRISIRENGERGKIELLHHFVMGLRSKIHLDHIDGNGLNCRSHNIRVATNSQNAQNSRKSGKNTTSKYKGVTWKKRDKKWEVRIQSQGQKIYLGTFESEIINGIDEGEKRAARKYDEQANLMFGSFARLNFQSERNVVSLKDGKYKRSFLMNEQETKKLESEIKVMAKWNKQEIQEFLEKKSVNELLELCHYYGCGVGELVREIMQGLLKHRVGK